MKFTLKEKAIKLRRQGFTYSEILKQIPVAKSTLSLWLRSVGLAKKQQQRLTGKKLEAIQKGAKRKHEIRVEKSLKINKAARQEARALINDPLWLTGTILYWAEGSKEKEWRPSEKVSFTNMDLNALKIFQAWVKRYCAIGDKDLWYELYIHQNANIQSAKNFWYKNLKIKKNTLRIYFKKHNLNPSRKNISSAYYGVLKIGVYKSTDLLRRIAGWTGGVVEYLGN